MAQKQRSVRNIPIFMNYYCKKMMYFNLKCIESDLKCVFRGERFLLMPKQSCKVW